MKFWNAILLKVYRIGITLSIFYYPTLISWMLGQ